MNYFEILELSLDATEHEVKKAYKYRSYRKLALKHHPDKSQSSSETFQLISEAYHSLIDSEKRFALSEKIKKDQATSETLKKLRNDLLQREKAGIVKVPKKRVTRPDREEILKVQKSGIRVEWSKSRVFTEIMIVQALQKYGEVVKVSIEENSAFVLFRNEMATVSLTQDRAVARPPSFFKVRRLEIQECEKNDSQESFKQEVQGTSLERLEILRKKLKESE